MSSLTEESTGRPLSKSAHRRKGAGYEQSDFLGDHADLAIRAHRPHLDYRRYPLSDASEAPEEPGHLLVQE